MLLSQFRPTGWLLQVASYFVLGDRDWRISGSNDDVDTLPVEFINQAASHRSGWY